MKENIINYFTKHLIPVNRSFRFSCEESEKLEYKLSLQISGESVSKSYLKTIAGFSNNKGGVVCFGIDPLTNELKGINSKFENLDNRYFSTAVMDGLDGVVEFSFFTHYFGQVLLGFLIVKESKSKPTILKSNYDNDGEKGIAGDIYFRYPARTSRVSYGDLRNMINHEIETLSKKFLNQVQYIATSGPRHTAILNTLDGEIRTEESTSKLILSKDILQELNLIQEGNIVQKEGAPAYVIKGSIQIEDTKFIEKQITKALHASELFKALFTENCDEPRIFLRELLFKDTPYYPIFIFIRKAKLTNQEAIELLETEHDTDIKKTQREKLIARINLQTKYSKQGKVISGFKLKDVDLNTKIDILINKLTETHQVTGAKSDIAVARSIAHCCLKDKLELPKNLQKKYLKEIFEAMTHLTDKEIMSSREYLLSTLYNLYSQVKTAEIVTKTVYRKIVSRIDEVLHSK